MKIVICLSGGRDSAVMLADAVIGYGAENIYTLTFDYGSTNSVEVAAAQKLAWHYGVRHQTIKIDPSIFQGTTSSLLGGEGTTIVPARNTLFGAYALAKAESLVQLFDENVKILSGQHKSDNSYPDCRLRYVQVFNSLAHASSLSRVEYCSPFIELEKHQILKKGIGLKVPFDLCISCYHPINGDIECGECVACKQTIEAWGKCNEDNNN